MRQNDRVDTRKAKKIAKQKYAERQIDKWVKWSWNNRGKIKYKELVLKQEQYGVKCYSK
jgi:hypothetical protein